MQTGSFTPVQVIEQLDLILASELFNNSTVLSQFLRFVVEETLAGQGKQLKEYTIGVKVLSKKSDFQPQTDPIVRIHAGRLRRTLVQYYAGAGSQDPIIISIPKGAYVPAFSGPDLVQPVPVISHDPEIVIRKKTTVAVLPFRNNSIDTGAVFFADGLGDQISTELAVYPELSVVSYYSCRSIADKITDIKEAGLWLDAKYILTGTIQLDKTRLRVRVQLVLSETREQLWTGSFEGKTTMQEYFEIQDEIVRKVVAQTAGHFGAIFRDSSRVPAKKNIDDFKVFDAIFWYYHFVSEQNEEIYHKALAAMRYSVHADPDYALGWAVLGEIYVGGYFMGYDKGIVADLLEEATMCGRKSLKIDVNCQHAYQTLGLAYLFQQNKQETLKVINDWLKLKQGAAGIMGGMGFCLICCGEYEKGIKMMEESIQLNPYYQWWFNGGFSFYHYKKEAFDDAIYWAEKMNLPHVPWESLVKTAAFVELDKMEEARHCEALLQERFPFLNELLEPYLNAFIQDKALTNKIKRAILKARDSNGQ